MHKLLIVENEALERKALKIIIEKELKDIIEICGYTGSGIEALELYKKLKPNLILMDINIYGINGIEVSEKIKKMDPNVIIMILTAYDKFDFIHKAIKVNVNDYILKPARPSRIVASIRNQIKSIKNDDIDILPMMKELTRFIHKVDYKGSKDILKRIINCVYSNDSQNIIDNLKEVIDGLLNIAFELEIYDDINIKAYRKKYKNDLDMFYDQYKAQKSLIEILDGIFSKLLSNKKDIYNNDINRILDYIEKNCKKNISLEEVAEFGAISPYYLSKLFKKKVGINFSTYLINKKIEVAKEILKHTDMPVTNIALELSYNEPNYFSKVFKKVVGVTPTEYRSLQAIQGNILKKNTFIKNGKWSI